MTRNNFIGSLKRKRERNLLAELITRPDSDRTSDSVAYHSQQQLEGFQPCDRHQRKNVMNNTFCHDIKAQSRSRNGVATAQNNTKYNGMFASRNKLNKT